MIYPDRVGSYFFTVTPRRLVPVPTLDRSSSSRPYSTTTCLLKYIRPLCVVKRKCYLLCKYCNEFCPDWFHSTSKVVRIRYFSVIFGPQTFSSHFFVPPSLRSLLASCRNSWKGWIVSLISSSRLPESDTVNVWRLHKTRGVKGPLEVRL